MLTLGYLFALMIVVKHGQGRQGVLYPKLWERRGSYSVVDEDDQRAFLKVRILFSIRALICTF